MGPRPKTAHEHHQSRQGLGRRPSWRGWEAVVPECQASWKSAIPPAPPTGISAPPPPSHPAAPVTPPPGSSLARTVSSGSMRILKVCCCSVLSVMVTAMAGPERQGSPRIFTQHATHAAAILAPSRAARRQLPGQTLRAPTIRMRDLRTSLPPTTWLSWACAQERPRTRRRVRSAPGKGG